MARGAPRAAACPAEPARPSRPVPDGNTLRECRCRRQVTRRFLATVLFTDIVGSTERAAELGDRAWRDLLERHHAVVRRELKAFHGREIDTAGDGFFALFEAPERAVRCAESIIAAVGSLGLQVRAGVHTGECEVIGGGVGGMAVHIGARVAALAGPGEVLVTGSVRDLMTGSDRHFDGGEPRQLKGVADPWPVYRLVPGGGRRRGARLPPAVDGAAVHPPAAPAAGSSGSRPLLVLALGGDRFLRADPLRRRGGGRGERGRGDRPRRRPAGQRCGRGRASARPGWPVGAAACG